MEGNLNSSFSGGEETEADEEGHEGTFCGAKIYAVIWSDTSM